MEENDIALKGAGKRKINHDVDSNYLIWKSEVYEENYFKRTNKSGYKYYDTSGIFKCLFYNWVTNWTYSLSKSYIEPYKLHPLPINDQILYWQPIFSKHVSDGIVRLESNGYFDPNGKSYGKQINSVLMRALFLTFWKRTLVVLLSVITTNILSMSISILVKFLLKNFNKKTLTHLEIYLTLLAITSVQIADGLLTEFFNYYLIRWRIVWDYCVLITVFQHGLCYRKKFFNNVEGTNVLNVCNSVLHSCSPDSKCSENPLYCPARRFQNREMNARMFSFMMYDAFHVALFSESIVYVFNFLSNFVYGAILISRQIKINLWLLYLIGLIIIFLMVVVEITNAFLLKFYYQIKDYRIGEFVEIVSELSIIKKLLYDDIATNIITERRNKELSFILIRLFLSFLNKSLCVVCNNLSFFILIKYFVKTVRNAKDITEIDTEGFLSTFYILFRIINSMFLFPHFLKSFALFYASYRRIASFLNKCSPNFYISDNKFTGSAEMSYEVPAVTNQIDKDVVVLYKDASFSWVNNRSDLANMNNEVYLKNVNFQLRRGEIAIITGPHGCGKSNFIKSVLGEMTLIDGSMAVVPLHTSMPIFYASQEIWLQQGTIRSNITFGHRFDEEIYNAVIKALELESDISMWEDKDLRVVSDKAHSLSCGQRVRMEMARAIYAYLVFSKVNKQYNNGECSFLMCLDSQFHGLDPYVSRTVFYNLFNSESGLLVKDDLSLVMSSSLLVFDKCIRASDLDKFPNIPIYEISDKFLVFYCYLSDVFSDKKTDMEVKKVPSSSHPHRMNFFNKDMMKLCYSDANTKVGRAAVTKFKYKQSFNEIVKNEYQGHKFNPYSLYLNAAKFTFAIFIIVIFGSSLMDNVKFVISTNLSDFINKNSKEFKEGFTVDLEQIKSRADSTLRIITTVVSFIISSSLVSSVLFAISSIVASRRIHEYCVSSVFKNSSTIIKIKKQIHQVITYISADIYFVDEYVAEMMSTALLSIIQTFVSIGILFYTMPLSIPLITLAIVLVFELIVSKYIIAATNIQVARLETMAHINTDCENAILSSPIYRSFKKEWELVNDIFENVDYKARCRFLIRCISTWASVLFNWIFSITTALFLAVMIIFDKFTNYEMVVGYFGLGLSLSMSAIKSFSNFKFCFANLQVFLCSVRRFQLFIPPGTKCVFDRFHNIHEEDLVVNSAKPNLQIDKKKLLRRRKHEFRDTNPNILKRLFFSPKINVIDIGKYLPSEHYGVVLKDVCVYTTSQMNNEGIILNNVTASGQPSHIIGIIGRTGAGKTTLLSVLQNTVRNRTGQVLLDGRDLQEIPKSVIRHIIGVLPQLPFVFKGWTIRRFLDPRKLFTDDEINQALDNCGLLEFVNRLPGNLKLDTVIIKESFNFNKLKSDNTNGKKIVDDRKEFRDEESLTMGEIQPEDIMLSISQLRTLWFAKLVLHKNLYRMIIIDEPPSDNISNEDDENNTNYIGIPIYELLDKYFKHCTCFVTAHYANVLKSCTSVWVMHHGRLIKSCSASDVSKNDSISNIIEEMVTKYSNN
ncbi:ABC transporter family protein [Theileria parva strain Muguga]|uniref:ABC transporter, putative n=1 Tax=Theileria parva TaxID=5875 RepID=Q4N5A0_THEPA|nr:ABC transporter family protein [Theileria parva strain Muguga]EAN32673.1 ABC transporter family protein [Theileria parva strain Muguga]|eukprot:XP_764956.1 ABC transporter [Theileria parva strain Muguga]